MFIFLFIYATYFYLYDIIKPVLKTKKGGDEDAQAPKIDH